MGFIDQKGIEARLAPLKEQFGENSDELWAEKLKVEAEYGMMLFKRPIVRCEAALRVVDDRSHKKGELFKLTARVRCAFRAQDGFIVPPAFHGLIAEGVFVRAERQMPAEVREAPLGSFERQPLSGGWKMDTLGTNDIMTFYLRAHEDVANVNFIVKGLAMPRDVYDEKKFWCVTEPVGMYDATDTSYTATLIP
jgi:hypothetical protein